MGKRGRKSMDSGSAGAAEQKVEWVSIGELLGGVGSREPVPVNAMVRTLQKKKAYTIRDEELVKLSADETRDAVRLIHRWYELLTWSEHNGPGQPPEDPDRVLEEDLLQYGWPENRLPDFSGAPSDADEITPSQWRLAQRAITALAWAIASRSPKYRHPGGAPNVQQVVDLVLTELQNEDARQPHGYSDSNLRDVIGDALRACAGDLPHREATEQAQPDS